MNLRTYLMIKQAGWWNYSHRNVPDDMVDEYLENHKHWTPDHWEWVGEPNHEKEFTPLLLKKLRDKYAPKGVVPIGAKKVTPLGKKPTRILSGPEGVPMALDYSKK